MSYTFPFSPSRYCGAVALIAISAGPGLVTVIKQPGLCFISPDGNDRILSGAK